MKWYCIYTKPKKEHQVESYCRTLLHLETFYPQLREYATVQQVRRLVSRSMFPRYFFCRFDFAATYRAVRYAHDALDIVHVAGGPSTVSDSLIAELRLWADHEFKVGSSRNPLGAGAPVEITHGPLRGLAAVILRARSDQDRVAILLSLLNSDTKISISRDWLRPLEVGGEHETAQDRNRPAQPSHSDAGTTSHLPISRIRCSPLDLVTPRGAASY